MSGGLLVFNGWPDASGLKTPPVPEAAKVTFASSWMTQQFLSSFLFVSVILNLRGLSQRSKGVVRDVREPGCRSSNVMLIMNHPWRSFLSIARLFSPYLSHSQPVNVCRVLLSSSPQHSCLTPCWGLVESLLSLRVLFWQLHLQTLLFFKSACLYLVISARLCICTAENDLIEPGRILYLNSRFERGTKGVWSYAWLERKS